MLTVRGRLVSDQAKAQTGESVSGPVDRAERAMRGCALWIVLAAMVAAGVLSIVLTHA